MSYSCTQGYGPRQAKGGNIIPHEQFYRPVGCHLLVSTGACTHWPTLCKINSCASGLFYISDELKTSRGPIQQTTKNLFLHRKTQPTSIQHISKWMNSMPWLICHLPSLPFWGCKGRTEGLGTADCGAFAWPTGWIYGGHTLYFSTGRTKKGQRSHMSLTNRQGQNSRQFYWRKEQWLA